MRIPLFSLRIPGIRGMVLKVVRFVLICCCCLYAIPLHAQQTSDGPFVPQKSMTEFRLLTADPSRYPAVYITDVGRNGMFRYDGLAASMEEDEGVMTLVTANKHRYTRVVEHHINAKWFGAPADGNGATIAAVYGNLYGGKGFVMAKRLFDAYAIGAPYNFDNAMYNSQSMDWFALQTGLNYCIKYAWETTAERQKFKTLYVPAGVYALSKELFAQKFQYGGYRHVSFSMTGEAGYYNGTVLRSDFSKTFALGIQMGVHCKIENISFVGQFTRKGSLTDRQFFNASAAAYKDMINPDCADGRYGPYAGIVIDPFFMSALPGRTDLSQYYGELAAYYRGDGATGGSTKTEINRVYIEQFVAGIVFSPNGVTNNNELVRMENISVRKVKAGIVLCQAQEKTNVIKHLSAWNDVHTVIMGNSADGIRPNYGAGTPGQWSIEDVDLAGRVNQFIERNDGGYFPLFVRNLFSESLGRIGTVSSIVGGAFEDCEIGFYHPLLMMKERGQERYEGFHAKWQLEGGGYTFKNCALRFYKNEGWPVAIAGNFKFENCVFESVPFYSLSGSYGQPLFTNCYTHQEGGFGNSGILSTQAGNFSKHVAYGRFVLRDHATDDLSVKQQFTYESHAPFRIVGEVPDMRLSANPANGDVVIPLKADMYDKYYRFARLALMHDPRNDADKFVPLGIIKNYDRQLQQLQIGGVRAGLPANITVACMLPVTTINPFIGDLEQGRSAITNVRLDVAANNYSYGMADPRELVGKVLLLENVPAVLANYKNYTVINGYDAATKTLTVADLTVAQAAKGVYFCNGCEKQREQKSGNFPVSAGELLQEGSRLVLNNGRGGKPTREYRVVQSGLSNAVAAGDARQAQLVPDFNYNNHADARFYGDTSIYFKSLAEALALMAPADRKRGMSVMVLNGGALEEYWFSKGIADADLVKKTTAPGGAAPSKTQWGSIAAGSSASQTKKLTLNFSTPFAAPPKLVLTCRTNGSSDVFTVNTVQVSATQAEIFIYCINGPKGWKQDVKVDWWAFE